MKHLVGDFLTLQNLRARERIGIIDNPSASSIDPERFDKTLIAGNYGEFPVIWRDDDWPLKGATRVNRLTELKYIYGVDRLDPKETNIQPIDPVALGLCKQSELDTAVQKAAAKKVADGAIMSDDERRKLVSTEQSLEMPVEPKIPSSMEGLEAFSLTENQTQNSEEANEDFSDADSFFNLPEESEKPEKE